MKFKAISEQAKPYLKRFFIISYGGGFDGYWREAVRHEIIDVEAREFYFDIDTKEVDYGFGKILEPEYLRTAKVMDGNYFDISIEHFDKHNKPHHVEYLKPIPVDNLEKSDTIQTDTN